MNKFWIMSVALMMVSVAKAGGDWEISWNSIDGGGTMEAAGGEWELHGTIGQHDATAADESAGGSWALTGGFWSLVGEAGETLDPIFSDRFEGD